MAYEKGQSPYYSSEKNTQIAKDNAAKNAAVSAAQKADAAKKGLIDSSGNYKTDELGRTFNTSTGKWEAGPETPTARAGYTNEGGSSSGGGSYTAYNTGTVSGSGKSSTPIAAIPTPTPIESPTYTPVNQDDYIKKVLSYDEALAMAKSALEPQYVNRYEQSAAQAAQNLGAAGLYDSVYGQALSADAQRDIDRDLEAAIQSLALQMKDKSSEEALALLQLAIGENQFGANFNQGAMLEDRAYNERNLDRMIAQANADRDYDLAQQAQDLKVRAQNYYEKQSNWQMGGFDSQYQMQEALSRLDNELQQGNIRLQSELSQQAAAAKSAKSGGSGGGGSVDLGIDSHNGPQIAADLSADRAQYNDMVQQYNATAQAQQQTTSQSALASEAAAISNKIKSSGISNFTQMLDIINNSTDNQTVALYAMVNLGITQAQLAQWQAQKR